MRCGRFQEGLELIKSESGFSAPRGFSTDQKHRLFAQLKRLQQSLEVEAEDTDRADGLIVA